MTARRVIQALCVTLCAGVARATLPFAFSFDTVQPFAFPGAAPRFMTQTEVAYFTANFSNILIWGLNATCLNGTSSYPATCPPGKSHCTCPADSPEDQAFVPNMEVSLQEQGRRLKAGGPHPSFFVLGYIEGLSAQKYYSNQAALMTPNSTLASYLLSTQGKGLIDCYRDGCNWQGVEFRQYDLRQPAARAYYVQQVIGSLINNSALDGTFIDSIDWWYTGACSSWGCTPEEAADLTLSSLLATEEMLAAAAAAGKVLSISSHTTLSNGPDYYLEHTAILARHAANAIRFWEFFTASEADLASLVYETGTLGLATHVHVTARTLVPDWEELAVFLLGMGAQSFFSYSGPWMLDSFAVYPEYTRPLGSPLGPPVNTSSVLPFAPWALIPDQNLAYNWPSCPGCNVTGGLQSFGTVATPAACLTAVTAAAPPAPAPAFTGMTWVPQDGSTFALHCYGRYDEFDPAACIGSQTEAAPCYASAQAGHVSAVSVAFELQTRVWTRSFEHLDVTWVPGGRNATLAWR